MSAMPDARPLRPDSPDLYRELMADYAPSVLRGICNHLDLRCTAKSPGHLASAVLEHLSEASHRADAVADLPRELEPALALMPYVPAAGWSVDDLRDVLGYCGCAVANKAVRALLGLGFLALQAPSWRVSTLRHFDYALDGYWGDAPIRLVPHPALAQHRAVPDFDLPPQSLVRTVQSVRSSDGLELLLRVAVLWQRIAEAPTRLTRHGALFKRDQERLFDDAVVASPLFDEVAPIGDIGRLALILARGLGLFVVDRDTDLLRTCLGSVWQDCLPLIQRQMWQALMATRNWNELELDATESLLVAHLPARRWATLLLLASLDPDVWITTSELANQVATRDPSRALAAVPRGGPSLRVVTHQDTSEPAATVRPTAEIDWMNTFLLGAMYQLGVVEAAEETSSGARVVRLSPLGRWLMAVAPQPAPPAAVEQTLLIQPNHEVVVYRQGLTPELLGQLASFVRCKALGAALTLELTADSVYRGLELGRTAEEMIGILERHSQRPLPPGVVDSMRTWSQRRERLRLYSRCAVLEFASSDELEQAVARGVPGERLTDRLLMVADELSIPFAQFRQTGSRDYRHPPAVCVAAADDGITWSVELARSDLLVGRELARFAEPVADGTGGERLSFRITPASLASAARLGLGSHYVREWFKQRAGRELPPSVELMLQASSRSPVELGRMLVLRTPTPAAADGLQQHPLTRQFIRSRLGPTTLAVSPDGLEALLAALRELGVALTGDAITGETTG